MTLFVRTDTGEMVDIAKAHTLWVDEYQSGEFHVVANFPNADYYALREFSTRENAEAFLNQIAARANAGRDMISPESTAMIRSLQQHVGSTKKSRS